MSMICPLILIQENDNAKNIFEDCANIKQLIKRYNLLKEVPIKNLLKEFKRNLKFFLKRNFDRNCKKISEADFVCLDNSLAEITDLILFYKKMNMHEYKKISEIVEFKMKEEAYKLICEEFKINEIGKIEDIKVTKKEFEKSYRIFKKCIKLLNKINTHKFINKKKENEIIREIGNLLLNSLENPNLIIFSIWEKKFLQMTYLCMKDPNSFLQKIYAEKFNSLKDVRIIFKGRLFNETELAEFIVSKYDLIRQECEGLFEMHNLRHKNISKIYFLLKKYDSPKAISFLRDIYLNLCNFIIKNNSINYAEHQNIKKVLSPLKKIPNCKKTWLIYKLYLYSGEFRKNKEYIHFIDKKIIKYFPIYKNIEIEVEDSFKGKYFNNSNNLNFNNLNLIFGLSQVKIKLYENIFTVTYIQYVLLKGLLSKEEGNKNFDKILKSENLIYFYEKFKKGEENEFSDFLRPHFEGISVLADKIIEKNFIDKKFVNQNYMTEKVKKLKLSKINNSFVTNLFTDTVIVNEGDEEISKINVHASIIQICKEEKNIKKLNLFKKLKMKINYAKYLRALKELEQKQYIKITKELVEYIP